MKLERGEGLEPSLLGATQPTLPELDVRIAPTPAKREALELLRGLFGETVVATLTGSTENKMSLQISIAPSHYTELYTLAIIILLVKCKKFRLTPMTNIVASIIFSVVTNTSEVFPAYNAITGPPATYDENGQPHISLNAVAYFETRPVPNPKTKTIVTTCKEITVLRFNWNGAREIQSEKVLWESNHVMRLEWK